jgi:hypothetical protein
LILLSADPVANFNLAHRWDQSFAYFLPPEP